MISPTYILLQLGNFLTSTFFLRGRTLTTILSASPQWIRVHRSFLIAEAWRKLYYSAILLNYIYAGHSTPHWLSLSMSLPLKKDWSINSSFPGPPAIPSWRNWSHFRRHLPSSCDLSHLTVLTHTARKCRDIFSWGLWSCSVLVWASFSWRKWKACVYQWVEMRMYFQGRKNKFYFKKGTLGPKRSQTVISVEPTKCVTGLIFSYNWEHFL